MDNILTIIGAIIAGIFIVAVAALVVGVFVMLLWNWLMPVIFGLGVITFWQGWGLAALGGFLFKSSNYSSNK